MKTAFLAVKKFGNALIRQKNLYSSKLITKSMPNSCSFLSVAILYVPPTISFKESSCFVSDFKFGDFIFVLSRSQILDGRKPVL